MVRKLVPDELWELIEPVIPKWERSPKGGHPRLEDRKALSGILFILKTGMPWEELPQEMGCGCGMTCWRRLQEWEANGTWKLIHQVLLDRLRAEGLADLELTVVDSSSVRAKAAGEATGPNPTDRRKNGSKHHVLVDAEEGAPVAVKVTSANTHDVTQVEPLLDAVPSIAGKQGHPKHKPDAVQGDRAYDSQPLRNRVEARGTKTYFAKRNTSHGSGLGKTRWIVERTLAWMHQYHRLNIRYERKQNIHSALLLVAAIDICYKLLSMGFC